MGLLREVEKYVTPIIAPDQSSTLSREENQILALQSIQRINKRIGMLARTVKESAPDMKLLQTFVNSMTIGIKSSNIPQVKYGLSQARNLIQTLESER